MSEINEVRNTGGQYISINGNKVRYYESGQGETVIFIHTGGLPGIYTPSHRQAFENELLGGVTLLP